MAHIAINYNHKLWRTSNAASLATTLNVSAPTAYKIINGSINIGTKIIIGAIEATGDPFEALFRIADDEPPRNRRQAHKAASTASTATSPDSATATATAVENRLPNSVAAMRRDPRFTFGTVPEDKSKYLTQLTEDDLTHNAWRYTDDGEIVLVVLTANYFDDKDDGAITGHEVWNAEENITRPEVIDLLQRVYDLTPDEIVNIPTPYGYTKLNERVAEKIIEARA